MTYLEQPPSTGDKIINGFLVLLILLAIVCIPFMIVDKQRRLDDAWNNQGCKMYDKEKVSDIPAKCNNDFVDHYNAQERREQP